MKFDLAAMAQRANPTRRASLNINVIKPTKALSDELATVYMNVPRVISGFVQTKLMPAYSAALARLPSKDSLITDDVSDVQGGIDSLGDELQRLILTLVPELRAWTMRTEKWQRGKWTANVMTATNVSLDTLIGPADAQTTLDAFLARNVALVKDLSAEAQGRVANAVWAGFQARSAAREVARQITTAVTMARSRALRIASDQTAKLSAALDTERRQQAGIDTWIWRWSHKTHGRPEHAARDGEEFSDQNPPSEMPGDLPFCGCRAQAVVKFDENS